MTYINQFLQFMDGPAPEWFPFLALGIILLGGAYAIYAVFWWK
jgi:hypothetical protein